MKPVGPADFRIGDRVRLRKPHPCGGWTWVIDRLGADIGLTCETCGRHVLLDRRTLARRVKSFLARGAEPAERDAPAAEADIPPVRVGDALLSTGDLEVSIRCYYATGVEHAKGRLTAGDLVRIVALNEGAENHVLLEPARSEDFERTWVPGGVRAQETYMGFAIMVDYLTLAGSFEPAG